MESRNNKLQGKRFNKVKLFISRQRNKFYGILLLMLGIALGVAATTVYPQVSSTIRSVYRTQPIIENVEVSNESKKQALESFFRGLTEAESNDDWQKLYMSVNPADKSWFTIEDMTLQYKKDKYSTLSTEVIVHDISVSGDTGSVDNTVIRCKTEECTGDDKLEKRTTDRFIYTEGQWYRESIKEPSDKARQLSAYIYNFYKTRTDYEEKLVNKYGGGQDDLTRIIRTISIMIENDPEYFAYTEAWVEKNKAEASRPSVYVDSPDVIQQPVQQQPSFSNRINCSSNTIGNYTYTNCY